MDGRSSKRVGLRIGLAVVAIFLVLSLSALAEAAPTSDELRLFELVNNERVDRGLQPLVWHDNLYEAAEQHSQEMIEYDYFSHVSPVDGSTPYDRVVSTGYYDDYMDRRTVRENIFIKSGGPDPDLAHQMWMESPGHRANILATDINEMGAGCYSGEYKGTNPSWDCTEVFAYHARGADSDGDGVPDESDDCPTEPETQNGYEDDDGCPDELPDSDNDGIPDAYDSCPTEPETYNGYEDDDGCPDRAPLEDDPLGDSDGDGIPNILDDCPDEGETFNGYMDFDGCPDEVPSGGSGGGPISMRDSDGDGIPDVLDKCPDEPETINGYKDWDGCPDVAPPKDSDHDGIIDSEDDCPTQPETYNGYEDLDGCPDKTPDTDGDGIKDGKDACPSEPETFNGYKDSDGCPDSPPDSDGDGFPDTTDLCPAQPETFNGYMDGDGCPDTAPVKDTDGDGIPDSEDSCPTQLETFNGYIDDDGCPDTAPVKDTDGDGLIDAQDQCPTEPETFNDYRDWDGCPDEVPGVTVIKGDVVETPAAEEYHECGNSVCEGNFENCDTCPQDCPCTWVAPNYATPQIKALDAPAIDLGKTDPLFWIVIALLAAIIAVLFVVIIAIRHVRRGEEKRRGSRRP